MALNWENTMLYEIYKKEILKISLDSEDKKNKINSHLIKAIMQVLDKYEAQIKIVLIEGNDTNFCTGADFDDNPKEYKPENLYNLWYRLAIGPFVTISHVKGKVIAGGMGFVGASDIVIADVNATFSMTELLFGIYPALVFPFLTRKAGFSAVNYMALTMETISANQAQEKGIVDVCGEDSKRILGKHLAKITKIPKSGIVEYKKYVQKIIPYLIQSKETAVNTNAMMFQDDDNKTRIHNFSSQGVLPWEL